MFSQPRSWVLTTISALLICAAFAAASASAEESNDDAVLKGRFQSLSQHGNVECSAQFEKLIGSMGPEGRLQGSCCAPMDEARYRQQIEGVKKYTDIAEVPPDPYSRLYQETTSPLSRPRRDIPRAPQACHAATRRT